MSAGNEINITAGAKIELTVGMSKITMDPGSIAIESPVITIKASASLTAEGSLTDVKAQGVLTLKGALITIN